MTSNIRQYDRGCTLKHVLVSVSRSNRAHSHRPGIAPDEPAARETHPASLRPALSDSRALPAPHANSRHIAVTQDGWRYSGPPREQFELSRAQDCSPGRLAPMPRRKACQWRRNSRRCRLGSSSATCLSYRGNMTVSASGEEAVQGTLLTCIARTSLSESICASWRP